MTDAPKAELRIVRELRRDTGIGIPLMGSAAAVIEALYAALEEMSAVWERDDTVENYPIESARAALRAAREA